MRQRLWVHFPDRLLASFESAWVQIAHPIPASAQLYIADSFRLYMNVEVLLFLGKRFKAHVFLKNVHSNTV